jgi:hypothetical protein
MEGLPGHRHARIRRSVNPVQIGSSCPNLRPFSQTTGSTPVAATPRHRVCTQWARKCREISAESRSCYYAMAVGITFCKWPRCPGVLRWCRSSCVVLRIQACLPSAAWSRAHSHQDHAMTQGETPTMNQMHAYLLASWPVIFLAPVRCLWWTFVFG